MGCTGSSSHAQYTFVSSDVPLPKKLSIIFLLECPGPFATSRAFQIDEMTHFCFEVGSSDGPVSFCGFVADMSSSAEGSRIGHWGRGLEFGLGFHLDADKGDEQHGDA